MSYTGNRNSLIENNIQREYGGTLVGIVAGLLVGLAIALTVAIYVTKVPVPFVQKVTPAAAPKPEDEAKKNSTWDPNAPLYGKHPAGTKPPGEFAADANVNPNAPPPSPLPASAPVAPAQAKADKPKPPAADANDPIGQIAKATQSPAKPPAVATTAPKAQVEPPVATPGDPWIYYLQAGAFRDEAQADAQRAKLALNGFDAKITEREQAGSPIYRVRMGPYNTLDEVNKAKAKLDTQGIEGATVRVPRS
jgi:cell division protein FtsN